MKPTIRNYGLLVIISIIQLTVKAQTTIESSRLGEVFQQTILVSGPLTTPSSNRLFDPWEITYGPDDSLWVTEAKGYKVKKIHPGNAGQRTILNLTDAASGGTFLPSTWRRQFASTQNPWPQGGMMGLAIHPDFNHPTTPKKFVYITYVHNYITPTTTTPLVTNYNGETVNGHVFVTWLVRFSYDGANLVNPVAICDTIRGSNDHNSGRLIIKPVGGVNYLFYALGDLGAGQFANINRIIKSQDINSYEGKILRFNLESDGDAGAYDQWLPNDNPFNTTLGKQSAVWSTGMRNNQGFAYNPSLDKLYGSSHGPFSDDELNIIEMGKNYGHPLIIGYSADGNYNNAKAGPSGSSLPLITSETTNATTIGAAYKDPIYSFYNPPAGNTTTPWTIQYIYTNQNYTGSPGPTGLAQNVNIHWKSEAVSGLDFYSKSYIPGWKNSLLSAALKGGRVLRTKLDNSGNTVVPTAGGDTVTYFRSVNRFRDIAISPDGREIFVVIDSSSVTSGPTTTSPLISACRGCLQKYTFLGYNDISGVSDISTSIPVAPGVSSSLTNGTQTLINAQNNNLWVPITDSLGNVIAEIKANGNNLGTITSSLYIHSGMARSASGKYYLNRSLTITPQTQPSSAVTIRLYLTAAELADLVSTVGSGVSTITDLNIYKNTDANSTVFTNTPTLITPSARTSFGSDYVITASITSFSSFYFASDLITLPLKLISFTGKYVDQAAQLKWVTESEINTRHFEVERSLDGRNFEKLGIVDAGGNSFNVRAYHFIDNDATRQNSPVLYYRLKMVDRDGSYSYSNIIVITTADITGKVTLMPNPVVSGSFVNMSISAPVDGKIRWKLIDNSGRTVMHNSANINKGNNNLQMNIERLPAGIYFMDISGAGIEQKVKLQKL
jgi:trimeric autotransporter adhesin